VYGPNTFSALADLRLVRVGFVDGVKIIGPYGVINRIGGQKTDNWVDLVHRYWTVPNSQVKNFLVACRTYLGGLGTARVVIRGSSAGQGSGVWIALYSTLLLRRDNKVIVDCYDPSELPGTDTFVFGERTVIVNHIRGLYEGDGADADVVIDDAWTLGSGIELVQWKSKYWSQKGGGQEVFLHTSETRSFSAGPSSFRSLCACMTCRVVSQCVQDHGSYVFLRTILASLGLPTDCTKHPVLLRDLIVRHDVRQKLLTSPEVSLFRPAEFRAIISLRDEKSIKAVSSHTYALTKGESVQVKHRGPKKIVASTLPTYAFLVGKRIAFSGCAPSVVGQTKIIEVPYAAAGPSRVPDITFFGAEESVEKNLFSQTIYVPGHFQRSSWVSTGNACGIYKEYQFRPLNFFRPLYGYNIYRSGKLIRRPAIDLYHAVSDKDERANQVELSTMVQMANVFQWSCVEKKDGWVEILNPVDVEFKHPLKMLFRDDRGRYGLVNAKMWDRTLSKMFLHKYPMVPSDIFRPKELIPEDEDPLFEYLRQRQNLSFETTLQTLSVSNLGSVRAGVLKGSPWELRPMKRGGKNRKIAGEIMDYEIKYCGTIADPSRNMFDPKHLNRLLDRFEIQQRKLQEIMEDSDVEDGEEFHQDDE
jgi:hypothetical protein